MIPILPGSKKTRNLDPSRQKNNPKGMYIINLLIWIQIERGWIWTMGQMTPKCPPNDLENCLHEYLY